MYKRILIAFLIALTSAYGAAAQDVKLSELSKLKVENLKLKAVVAQCKSDMAGKDATIASFELSAEQKKLLDEFRKELNAEETDIFDWNSLTFKPAK